MENKKLGIILIVVSLIFIIPIIIFKLQVNNLISTLMIQSGGSCITEGQCAHEQSDLPIYLGISITVLTMALGLYLIFFDKAQKAVERTQLSIVNALQETKKKQDKDEKFEYLLKALDEDEKKVIRAIREQDGIEQSTLRIRTDLSKTKLSVILSGLEKKDLVRKVPEGKKNKIYLKNKI